MSVPVTGPGIAPGGTPGAGGGTHTVGVRVVFTSDASQASREVKTLADGTKNLAQESMKAQAALQGRTPNGVPVIGAANLPPSMRPFGGMAPAYMPVAGRPMGYGGYPPGMPMYPGFPGQPGYGAPGMMPPGGVRMVGGGGSGGGGGIIPGLDGWRSKAADATFFLSMWNNFAQALNKLDDASVSSADKIRELAGIVPIVGSVAQGMYDAYEMIGARLSLGEQEYNRTRDFIRDSPIRRAQQQFERQKAYTEDELSKPTGEAAIRGQVYSAFAHPQQYNLYSQIDAALLPDQRAELVGQQDSQRRIMAAERERAVARRQAETSGGAGQGRFDEAMRGVGELTAARANRERREQAFNENPFAGTRMQFRDAAERVEDARLKALHQIGEAEKRVQEARQQALNLAEKDYQVQQEKTRELNRQLVELEKQKAKTENAAASFLLRAPDEQAALMQAAQRVKEKGFESLTREQMQIGQSDPLFREFLQEQAIKDARERTGVGGGRFAQFQKMLFPEGDQRAQDLKTIEQAIKETRVQADVKVVLDEQAFIATLEKVNRLAAGQLLRLEKAKGEIQKDAPADALAGQRAAQIKAQ